MTRNDSPGLIQPARTAPSNDHSLWGLMRHDGYLASEDLAIAILSVISLPRGAHITLLELEPEAPVIAPVEPR